MIYDYVVTLKNQHAGKINAISLLLTAISAAFFLMQQIRAGRQSFIYLVAFLLITAGLVWNWHQSAKRGKPVSFSRILLVAGITWFAMPYWPWIGVPFILLAILEKPTRFNLEIGFTGERIMVNTLIKRKYAWNEFNNILLKDGMLTMDFKNNRIIQKETIDEDGDADEEEFNAYCSSRLAGHAGPNG